MISPRGHVREVVSTLPERHYVADGFLDHMCAVDAQQTLAEAEILYARLFKMRKTADKIELLREIFSKYRPLTLKYFIKVITGNGFTFAQEIAS